MAILLENISTANDAERGIVAGTFLHLSDGATVLVEPTEAELRSLLDLAKPVSVHYHPRLTMHERDWKEIQGFLSTLVFDSERIEHQRTLTYQELSELPHRIYAGGIAENSLFLSHPVDFQGPWYTRKPVHYGLLNDIDGRIFKVWINLHLGLIEKVEGQILPGHYI
jgi:hypothetical protein